MTRKFRGGVGAFIGLLLMFLMFGVGMLLAAFYLPEPHESAQTLAMRFLFGLTGLGCSWYYGWGLLEWFTVYEVDADGITRRAWNGRRYMRWADVVQYKASGHKDGTVTLRDDQNNELSVCFSLLSARYNRELREFLAPYLAPARERQMRDISGLDTVYRPNRGQLVLAGALVLALGAFFFIGGLTMLTGRSPDREGAAVAVTAGLLLLLPGARVTIWALTRTMTVTPDGLTESSRFGSKTVLFHQVTALTTREAANKGDRWEATLVEDGGGRKILLNSKMMDYPLLVEYIRARVPHSALNHSALK